MIRVVVTATYGVDCRLELPLNLPASAVWGQLRGFQSIVTRDPFHRRVDLHAERPAAGARFDLLHGFGPIRLMRHGRILTWCEGRGYAFSDLSRRGVDRGFPHVYVMAVEPDGSERSDLVVHIRGRWTARWIPRCIIRGWLWGVMALIRVALRAEFDALRAARRARC